MWLKRLFVQVTILPEYRRLVGQASTAAVIGEKVAAIYAVSHILGAAAAVDFVKANDPLWGPVAGKIVDTVNGHMDTSTAIIAGLLARG